MCIWPFGAKVEDSFRRELDVLGPGPIKLEASTVSGDVTIERREEGKVSIQRFAEGGPRCHAMPLPQLTPTEADAGEAVG